jgi:hypothetical protein
MMDILLFPSEINTLDSQLPTKSSHSYFANGLLSLHAGNVGLHFTNCFQVGELQVLSHFLPDPHSNNVKNNLGS